MEIKIKIPQKYMEHKRLDIIKTEQMVKDIKQSIISVFLQTTLEDIKGMNVEEITEYLIRQQRK